MIEIKINGLAELQQRLDDLPVKLERNILRGGLRAGMNVIKPEAQRNIRSVSGKLAAGLRVGTGGRGGTVHAYLRARGPHAYIAKWLEFGTKAHNVGPKLRKAMRIGGDFVRGSFVHPGISGKAFLRPALEAKAGAAVLAMAEYMAARVARWEDLDKPGLTFELEE